MILKYHKTGKISGKNSLITEILEEWMVMPQLMIGYQG